MRRRELLKLSAMALGTGVSASVSRAVLAGAGGAAGTASSKFTGPQRAAVSLLSDLFIPATDTPGAVDAGVPEFVATIVFDWYTRQERESFQEGLQALDAFCQAREGAPFHQASEATRLAALSEQERIADSYQAPPAPRFGSPADDVGRPFFDRMKELVVLGYYTSEVGATRELIYLPVPGRYDGAFDFSRVGRQWTY